MSTRWSAHDPSAHCVGTSPSRTPRRGGMTEPSPFHRDVLYAYLKYAQRMSWPLPIGLKRMPPTLAA
jgi:hypothetical protein